MIIYVSAAVNTVFSDESRGFKNLGTFDSVFKMTVVDFYGKLFFLRRTVLFLVECALLLFVLSSCIHMRLFLIRRNTRSFIYYHNMESEGHFGFILFHMCTKFCKYIFVYR